VMGKNVLVVSMVEDAADVLRAHFAEADTIKVVVPVTGQGILDWLASDEKAFGHAEQVAERTAERLPGETVDAVAGEANVGLAIRDALATFPADEIVVAVRPDEEQGVVELIATEGAPQHSVEGVPVRYVVVPD
jgi:transcription antitermination factor NusA-like protein